MTNDTQHDDSATPEHGGARQPEGAANEKKYWLDDLRNVHKIYYGLWIVCGLIVLADSLYEKHVEFPIEETFGFFGFYGFISCVFLVLAAKQLRRIVGRDEDYYDR